MTADLDPAFARALRAELVAGAVHPSPVARARRWLGIGIAALLVVGTASVASATLGLLPGARVVSAVGEARVVVGTGSRDVDLGPRPDAANGVSFDFRALDPGNYKFGLGGAGATLGALDVASGAARTWGEVPLSSLDGTVFRLVAPADASWELTVGYSSETVLPLAVNSNGETYGSDAVELAPDLIAAEATNGEVGYIRATELAAVDGSHVSNPAEALAWQAENEGKTFTIPVYEADGTTVIGEFHVG